MMKLSKTAAASLKNIWIGRVAYGVTDRTRDYRITKAEAAQAGYQNINRNTARVLLEKGLVRKLVTLDEYRGHRVVVLVLTDAGRAAAGF